MYVNLWEPSYSSKVYIMILHRYTEGMAHKGIQEIAKRPSTFSYMATHMYIQAQHHTIASWQREKKYFYHSGERSSHISIKYRIRTCPCIYANAIVHVCMRLQLCRRELWATFQCRIIQNSASSTHVCTCCCDALCCFKFSGSFL
jgi:hypothetical protein